MTATFKPKPLFEDNASGMHVHQSLWKDETDLFYDKADYAELSELGRYYIGGLLSHARAFCGVCAPTSHSSPSVPCRPRLCLHHRPARAKRYRLDQRLRHGTGFWLD